MVRDGHQGLGQSEQRALLELASAGTPRQQRDAQETLLDDFRGPAMAVIHKTLAAHGVSQEHADSVLQQAVVKFLARGIGGFRHEAAPRTYFCRIAINVALDTCRRQGRAGGGSGQGALEMTPGSPEGPEAALLRREGARRLMICLERLAEHYRLAVEVFYLEERGDAATCARQAGISVQAFWQRLSRARAMLADCMRRGAVLGSEET